MARVLILTASYGSGHNAAAATLAGAFQRSGTEVAVVDHFRELVHPAFERATRTLYYCMLRRAPRLWGTAYAIGDWMVSDSALALGFPSLGIRKLERLLARLAPDAVVTVHATPALAMAALAGRGPVPPHTTVVTDFVAHSQWIAPGVDRYCVAAEEVKHEFVARGIAPERIVVTGVPVRPEFDKPLDPGEARSALGLAPNRPVVLAMAGAQGAFGRLPDVARVLREASLPLQGLVVTGLDSRVAESVRARTDEARVRTLGHVAEVRRLMAAADVLISKAGGMTLAEAMASELPLIAYASLPGQERRNERFASRVGVALIARSRRELARALERALREPDLLEHLRERIRRVRKPDATRRIVDAVLERDMFRR